MTGHLRREIRLLKVYAAGSTLALVFLSAAAFRQPPTASSRPRFDEIDVERINIVEKTGRVRLVIANSERQAVTVVDGKPILPNRKRDAGLIFFFNDEGDENGGMTWSGRTDNGDARASAGRSFDQYKQDETVSTSKLVLSDANAKPRLTLSVDRAGAAKIEFLDDAGKVVRSITP